MKEEVAQWQAKDRKGYWPNGPNRPNKANWPYWKEKSSVLIILN